jgi:hypothetical protein
MFEKAKWGTGRGHGRGLVGLLEGRGRRSAEGSYSAFVRPIKSYPIESQKSVQSTEEVTLDVQ